MSKRKRPQSPKPRNKPLSDAMQEIRRSSAASPHRNKSKYNRKAKHPGKDWE